MISPSLRERILDHIDVRAILDELGLVYEERGRGDLWACCPLPWHEERTPSCKINARFGHWHCFGCKRAKGELDGGFVTLVAILADMRSRMSVDEHGVSTLNRDAAWRWLAKRVGVSLDPVEQLRSGAVSPRRWKEKVPDEAPPPALEFPAGSVLATQSPEAMAYLLFRGFRGDTEIMRLGLRYWPDRRRVLIPAWTDGELANWDARAIDVRCSRCRRVSPVARCPRGADDKLACPHCRARVDDVRPKTFGAEREKGARPEWSLGFYDLLPRRADTVIACEGPFGAAHLIRLGFYACFLRGSALHDGQLRLLARWPRLVVLGDGDAAGAGIEAQLAPLVALAADAKRPLREVCYRHLPPRIQPDDLSDAAAVREQLALASVPRIAPAPRVSPAPLRSKV